MYRGVEIACGGAEIGQRLLLERERYGPLAHLISSADAEGVNLGDVGIGRDGGDVLGGKARDVAASYQARGHLIVLLILFLGIDTAREIVDGIDAAARDGRSVVAPRIVVGIEHIERDLAEILGLVDRLDIHLPDTALGVVARIGMGSGCAPAAVTLAVEIECETEVEADVAVPFLPLLRTEPRGEYFPGISEYGNDTSVVENFFVSISSGSDSPSSIMSRIPPPCLPFLTRNVSSPSFLCVTCSYMT